MSSFPPHLQYRRRYRQLVLSTPGASYSEPRGLSGVILHAETVAQRADDGRDLHLLARDDLGLAVGVTLDRAWRPLPGSAAEGEVYTQVREYDEQPKTLALSNCSIFWLFS